MHTDHEGTNTLKINLAHTNILNLGQKPINTKVNLCFSCGHLFFLTNTHTLQSHI